MKTICKLAICKLAYCYVLIITCLLHTSKKQQFCWWYLCWFCSIVLQAWPQHLVKTPFLKIEQTALLFLTTGQMPPLIRWGHIWSQDHSKMKKHCECCGFAVTFLEQIFGFLYFLTRIGGSRNSPHVAILKALLDPLTFFTLPPYRSFVKQSQPRRRPTEASKHHRLLNLCFQKHSQ